MNSIHVGDVAVHRGEPPNGNPYKGQGLLGPERAAALAAWKNGAAMVTPKDDTGTMWAKLRAYSGEAQPQPRPLADYTFWYAPAFGGARRIAREEVAWETSGL